MQDQTPPPEQTHSPYAGRWVARVRGKIVAQGGTPEQALRASQHSRYKEKPEITFMPVSFTLPPLIKKIMDALPADQKIYLVGGAVRDLLDSRISSDFDFALPSNGISLARKVANSINADFLPLDDERDTGRVIVANEDGSRIFLDFAVYRGANLEEDLRARDFTMNAIAYNLRDETIIDPLDGGNDLREKLIRACSQTSLSDDPVRILRAVRQAAAFDFHIEKNTRELMKQAANQLGRISPERLRDEVFKILNGPKPEASMRALEMLGVFPYLMPELTAMKGVEQSDPHVYDVWTHTLAVLDHLDQIISALCIDHGSEKISDKFTDLLIQKLGHYQSRFKQHFDKSLNVDRSFRSLLFFSALYHDVSKPETKTVEESGRTRFFDHDVKGAEVAADRVQAFNLSTNEVERLHVIIKNHMRIHFFANRLENEKQTPSRKAIYRFFRDSGEAGVDLVLLGLADLRGIYVHTLTIETWNAYLEVAHLLLENYWERPEEIISPPRLLGGNDLMKELNIHPGPVIGQLLESIRENQAAGKIENREQALSFAREELAKGPS
ncbi:MAG: HD domain-containing protein [Anaerolineales bacterium]|nr:HD domain-containing protein [Anaerolineales bacterium]